MGYINVIEAADHGKDTEMHKLPTVAEVARLADLDDESSMADVLDLIAAMPHSQNVQLLLDCCDRDDPSQMYDVLVILAR